MASGTQRLYDDLAAWWPVLSPPTEYAEEAAFYARLLRETAEPDPRTVLELGSGGGNNALHMKQWFTLTLVDPSPGMLAHSRQINPECEHQEGDMRTFRLSRRFDGVFIHDAICYMTTEADLRMAVATAYEHLCPGGSAVFAPDFTRETFRAGTDHGGSDGEERALRYLEWVTDPDPTDSVYTVDYAFLLREPDGTVNVAHDRHVEGLFSRNDWLQILTDVGFKADVVPFQHSELDYSIDVLVGKRPGDPALGIQPPYFFER